ncbi:MAG: hypothetical protein N2444_09825, partial [Methylocystis sp.]|nr:hypothetical protein [Methylocystis sp.]
MPYGVILSLRRTAGALTLASLLLAALAALAARAEDAAPAAAPAPEAAAPDASSIAPQAVAPAASTCQTDFQRLMSRRMAGIQKLNALGKAGKGKMDPIAACP